MAMLVNLTERVPQAMMNGLTKLACCDRAGGGGQRQAVLECHISIPYPILSPLCFYSPP